MPFSATGDSPWPGFDPVFQPVAFARALTERYWLMMRGQSAYVATMRLTRPPLPFPPALLGVSLRPAALSAVKTASAVAGDLSRVTGTTEVTTTGRGVDVGSGVVVPPHAAVAHARTAPTAMSRGDQMA